MSNKENGKSAPPPMGQIFLFVMFVFMLIVLAVIVGSYIANRFGVTGWMILSPLLG